MFDRNMFVGKRIMVTGASSGIGRSTAILLGHLGATVILIGRNQKKLENTLQHMEGRSHIIRAFDLRAFDQYDAVINDCIVNGKMDGLVHCAGIAPGTPVKGFTAQSIHEILDINLVAFLLLSKYMSKKSVSNDRASIVGISSMNAHVPTKALTVYGASKGALEVSAKCMAGELYDKRKIRINTIVAGPVVTPMAGYELDSNIDVGVINPYAPNLMGRSATNNIAQMVVFLLSDASSFSTGRNFYADGGMF